LTVQILIVFNQSLPARSSLDHSYLIYNKCRQPQHS